MEEEKQTWYFTASLHMHNHPRYEKILEQIYATLQYIHPDGPNEVLEAKGRYQGAQDWRSKWPQICAHQITGGLFFMLDEENSIGRGVYTEAMDVLKKGLPVYLMTPEEFIQIGAFDGPAFIEGPDWQRYLMIKIELLEPPTVDASDIDFDDFAEQIKPEHWQEVHTRLITPTMQITLSPDKQTLALVFPDKSTRILQRSDIESLTRFLDDNADVEPLAPIADRD